ncbi:hypothetical protein TGME49_248690 [Toxoplasma gondii ME49]|uniref:Uncharacterized protein n=7 Tax=Toxoplasma gondii TaxID=5811 RepID=A0A125YHW2_TOXGV|nr:hypothetical protein TGME49_248690 [Toxoplasma gondii ME49]ESS34258.1 hypothetical protein TGVEG_248690 [Toxoplasma gondii VEG]KFH12112.1 hypothetical protein TGVAND_248690 [Toxoplasma gondii VAND]KFH15972.1 hypothetical protein TGMAS_248690 [Toxoplasma gondii MAS]KYF49780.1 hypothetical protein TGARI_248690 [Toxoplasma gondii ARI]PUA90725.1 hypothetical protein TGBR9_248690 [Toxoplasma gondii TgCATBr9]|eukprot:XP_018635012.1 hypothetical protein TGME49_248690 [Toxoplasma gondii ME49]
METTRQSHVRAALKHARTRLLTLSAFRKVVEDYDLLDTYYGYDMDLTTMDSLERQPSAPASSTNLGRSGATAEEEALAKKHGAKCYVSRGILAEPPQFTRNSRAFFQLRKHQVDMMPARRKTAAASPAAAPGATGSAAAPPGKLPASALPGKGAVAALKATQAQKVSEASQPPAVAPSATQPPAASPPDKKKPQMPQVVLGFASLLPFDISSEHWCRLDMTLRRKRRRGMTSALYTTLPPVQPNIILT